LIIVSLGSNRQGKWGSPAATVARAFKEIAAIPGANVYVRSGLFETKGIGPGRPGNFVNAVMAFECHFAPESLMACLKRLEREAGPRSAMRWGPRPLDLDILDYRGRTLNWSPTASIDAGSRLPRLVLPHPSIHLRPFVLEPLAEILPGWRHPVFHLTARRLHHLIRNAAKGRVLRRL
jgi:2-amino-4-hydroxy-6-hydroxymethyldihydropteridine diphosphokinase